MKICFSVAFIAFAYCVQAQNVVIKKDGEHILYKKMKDDGDYAELVTAEKKRIKVLYTDIAAKFDDGFQSVQYRKPDTTGRDIVEQIHGKVANLKPMLMWRKIVGPINVYTTEIGGSAPRQSANPGGGFTMTGGAPPETFYVVEKGIDYAVLSASTDISGAERKRTNVQSLKSFVHDDQELLKMLDGESNLKERELFDVVKKYNLKHFEKPLPSDYTAQGSIGFYTDAKDSRRENMVLKVNDSIEYKIPAGRYPLVIKLPINKVSKVCLNAESGGACELLQPNEFAVEYYELFYKVSGSFSIDKKTNVEFKNRMLKSTGVR